MNIDMLSDICKTARIELADITFLKLKSAKPEIEKVSTYNKTCGDSKNGAGTAKKMNYFFSI